MATIHDVAKRAGVSISTVSRCINNSGYVGKNTRKKIEKACEDLQFTPLQSARVLKTKKSNIIAFIIPTLRNTFFVELAGHIEREALKRNYKVVLCNIDGHPDVETSYIQMAVQHNFDGAIIATGTEVHKRLHSLPLVLLDRFETEVHHGSVVSSDHKAGSIQAVEHLIEKKCTNILYIRPKEYTMPAAVRQEGYEEAIRASGLEPHILNYEDEEDLSDIDYSQYDGVFAWADVTAIRVLFHVLKAGISVPEKLKLVGFDNSYLSGVLYPSLTTVSQPYEEMAQEAVKVLIGNIESGKTDQHVRLLPTELVIRETTE